MAKATKEQQVIPQARSELTAKWFSDVLPFDGSVETVQIDDIGLDVGFIGNVYRCHLTWTRPASDLPASVIVKVPTDVDENFAVGDGLQLYEREIMVYRELRDTLGLPIPGFLYGAMDPDPAPWIERPLLFLFDKLPLGGINWLLNQFLKMAGRSKRRYVLVLEDITDARAPTQAQGGSLEDALAALRVLATFHAHNWMRADIVESHSRIWAVDRGCRVYQANYLRNLENFRQRYQGRVSTEMFDRLEAIQQRAETLNRAMAAPPWTLIHGDYRLDNLLFRDDDITVLDLQSLGYGRPAVDVAYFVTTALTDEHRTEEAKLLRTYHDALVEAGVTEYAYETLIDDCDKAKEIFAHRIVGAADILDTEKTDGSADLLEVMQLRVFDWLVTD